MLVATLTDCRPSRSRVFETTVPVFFLSGAFMALLGQIARRSTAQAHLQRPSAHPMQAGEALTHRKKVPGLATPRHRLIRCQRNLCESGKAL